MSLSYWVEFNLHQRTRLHSEFSCCVKFTIYQTLTVILWNFVDKNWVRFYLDTCDSRNLSCKCPLVNIFYYQTVCLLIFYETFKTTFCSNLIEHFNERSCVKRFSMFKNLKAFYIELQINLQTTTGLTEN